LEGEPRGRAPSAHPTDSLAEARWPGGAGRDCAYGKGHDGVAGRRLAGQRRSTGAGADRTEPQNIFTIGNQIAVEPDGTLVDVFHFGKGSGRDKPNSSFTGLLRSTDGGQHWSPPILISTNPIAKDVDPDTGFPLRTGADVGGGIPDVAVDARSGKLCVV
jgi:hypothetical protein